VKFVEVRHYEMTVDAIDHDAAIRFAANGPDYSVSIKVELYRFEAMRSQRRQDEGAS
jgi:hypothetical protein